MQKNLPTIEETLRKTWEKTFSYPVRAFAISRTDAHVHAYDQWVKIMAKIPLTFSQEQLLLINQQLPADIQVVTFKNVQKGFNIIGAAKKKEYCYLFANVLPSNFPLANEKILYFIEPLDLSAMQEAAKCFIGVHRFLNFQRREKETAQLTREILSSHISVIHKWEDHFLDVPVFCFSVEGKGFLRQMVRIMMGAILNVGQGKTTIDELKLALKGDTKVHVGFVSPGYGLYLKKVTF